ncbi:MAG: tRNA uridine-5-carboxymethylaminomethyl(34) synthesis GTPase MnmE [Bacteroidaceae bacterium]|nr:tRNA uridine-5-carboxymethylaminomethyl(34) synthesis GTPase MnmE [Bacteroidaceae bacterium]
MNICALSTAKGGAIAVIRVSGPDAISIVDSVFSPAKEGNSLADAKGHTLHYGTIVNAAQAIDDVLVSVFRAPRSYTGENAVEISCHASPFIISSILQTLIDNGCRQALPGEYTQRAFLNGKMDLSQAEAVADIIASTNAATHRMAMSQLRGNFSSELASLRERLLHLTSMLELELDFSDHEDLEFADRSELLSLTKTIAGKVHRLAGSFKTGQALKHGVPVAIIGKTNVGKSTLLNRLLREDRAIVSDIHGTTRDVIEDTFNIQGIDFRFIDTAGLRDTTDEIERLGIERSYKKLDEATIVLWLIDCTPTAAELKEMRERTSGKTLIIVRNKIDLQQNIAPTSNCEIAQQQDNDLMNNCEIAQQQDNDLTNNCEIAQQQDNDLMNNCEMPEVVSISAKHNTGIPALEAAIVSAADIPEITENDIIITSARHYEALTTAHTALLRVIDGLSLSLPSDLVSEDLRAALASLNEITGGAITTDEVLSNIFAHFCIGK